MMRVGLPRVDRDLPRPDRQSSRPHFPFPGKFGMVGMVLLLELLLATNGGGFVAPRSRVAPGFNLTLKSTSFDQCSQTTEETTLRILPALLQKQQHHARGVRRAGRSKTKTRLNVEALDPRVLLSGMGHDHDHSMHPEHMAALKLVPREAASHVATSGNWSEIWGQGLPSTGAEVLIPHGVTVTVDGQFTESIDWIRVDGTLRFATDQDTALRVDTIVVDAGGRLQIGTEAQPVGAAYQAQVTFVDQGPINRMADPLGVGRGLIDLSGHLSIYGAETTNFVDLAQYPRQGDTVLQLTEVPTNWEVGGEVVVAGTNPILRGRDVVQDEVLTIVAIQGTKITIDRPLEYDHILPAGVSLPVAYLNRNVVLTSENTADSGRRGHIMIMPGGHDHVHLPGDPMGSVVAYARFDGLGRTRVDVAVTDPQLDEHGHLIPETTGNDRGRYSLHFHHMGIDNPLRPSTVRGVSVTHGLKWGVVNHESNVVVEDSVTYDVHGAGFATEFGNEIGVYRRNIAIRSIGSNGQRNEGFNGFDLDFMGANSKPMPPEGHDLGFQGYGFWLQGGGTPLIDNVAIGHARGSFAILTRPMKPGIMFPVANLPNEVRDILAQDLDNPGQTRTHVPISQVPFVFANNRAIASTNGINVYWHFDSDVDRRYDVYSRIENTDVVNVQSGLSTYHGSHIVQSNVRYINDVDNGNARSSPGYVWYGGSGDITWDNVTIVGFGTGINMTRRGRNVVNGGYYENIVNIAIEPLERGDNMTILNLDDANFGTRSNLRPRDEPWNIHLSVPIRPSGDISGIFERTARQIVWNRNGQTHYLYFREADPNYRFDSTDTNQAAQLAAVLPDSIRGMTAGELWDAHHAAVGGVIAPSDAFTVPGVHGVLSGIAPPKLPQLNLRSDRYTNQISGYTLHLRDDARNNVRVTVDLKPDTWNFITVNYQGQKVTELIYADATPPAFQLTDSSGNLLTNPPTISLSDLENGFTIYGIVSDTIGAVTNTTLVTRVIKPKDLVVDSDGKVWVVLTFSDRVGNEATVELIFTVV